MRSLAPFALLALLTTIAAPGCGGGDASSGGGATSSTGGSTSTATGATGTGGSAASSGGGGVTASGGAGGAAAGGSGGSGGSGAGGTGAGGSGGSAGGTGGTGGSGGATTTTGSGGGVGSPCTWGDDCGANLYCDAPGCGAGQCANKPVPAGLPAEESPVCGCDGVTYWNEPVAASKGQSVAAQGPCLVPLACGPQMPCPGGMKCRRRVEDAAACGGDAPGECWGTAISCSLDGPRARACSNGTCELECSLVQSQNPWYDDPTCN